MGELTLDEASHEPTSLVLGVDSSFEKLAGCDLDVSGVALGRKTKLGSSGDVLGPAEIEAGLSANKGAVRGVFMRFLASLIDEADVVRRVRQRSGVDGSSWAALGVGTVFHLATESSGSVSLSTAVNRADFESTYGICGIFCFSHGGRSVFEGVCPSITGAEVSKKDSVERSMGEKS